MRARVLAAVATTLVAGILGVLALGVAGTLLYDVPMLGLATGFVPPVMSWFVIAAVLMVPAPVALWRWRRARTAAALIVVAVLTAAGGSFVIARQVSAVEAAGARVDLLDTLSVWSAPGAAPDADETYGTFEGKPLGLSVFRPAPGGPPAPVLVFVHGGGWVAGERNAHAADFRWFADRGWLTISVGYSFSSSQRHLWDVVQSQIGCALTWVSANAGRYGGDGTKLSLSGDSAGGNLAINVGYLSAREPANSSCAGTMPRVSAVSTLYPAVDPAAVYDNPDPVLGDTSRGFAAAYLGGSPTEFPERFAAVAGATYIGPGAPPVLILLGATDHLVPVDGAYRFADQARDAGLDVRVVSVPYADHLFDARPGSIGQQAFRQLTASWLRDHGQGP